MATNLQVNANTQQAVGAFNALAASIANAQGAFNRLTQAAQAGTTAFNAYGASITDRVGGAFEKLTSLASSLVGILTKVAAGIGLVFNSLLRELDKLQGFNAIMSVTTKSSEEAAGAYDFLRKTSDKLGIQFDDLSKNYAKLVAAIPEGANRLQLAEKAFLGISMAARTLHASNQDTQLMFYAITQIASKGVVSMEELRRQLGEKLPGALSIAARSINVTVAELVKAVSKGTVDSTKFLGFFSDELIRTFSDSSQKASTSVSAAINRLTNVWIDFVKAVMDSGGTSSIINVFDALREKLSDPYLIQRFAELVKFLADKFTEFIKNISAEDIRNGFDTFTHGMEIAVNIMGKLIEAFTWIINNAAKAGAIIGGIAGAAVGLTAGPVGAVLGGMAGAAAGANVGAALGPTKNDLHKSSTDRDYAAYQAANLKSDQENMKLTQLLPLLQGFKDLKSLDQIPNLVKTENQSAKALTDIATILNGKGSQADKLQSLQQYDKSGVILGARGNGIKDVLGGKPKPDPEAKKLEAAFNKSFGLNPDFYTEWNRLTTLFKSGRLSLDELVVAQDRLLDKQPVIAENNKAIKKSQEEINKENEQYLDLIFKQVEFKEKMALQLDNELKNAGTHAEDLRAETEFNRVLAQYAEHRVTLSTEEQVALRAKLDLISKTKEITQAEDTIIAGTLDKYKQQVIQMQALTNLQRPEAGINQITNAQARGVIQDQNPELMANKDDALERQKKANEDFFAYLDGLRAKDLISQENYDAARARTEVAYQEQRLGGQKSFYDNIASLSSSSNKRLSAIGKAAAIASATIDGVIAVQKALAAPPGWPYNAASVISVGISAAANVAKIAGFESGGYTGNGGTSDVAGMVHGREFVVHADATAKNRATLEAMNRGQVVDGNGGGGSNVTVIVNNKVDGTKATQEQRDTPNGREIEVTIERVVNKQIKNGGSIATSLEQQYSLNRAAGSSR